MRRRSRSGRAGTVEHQQCQQCQCSQCGHDGEGSSCVAIVPIFSALTPHEQDEIALITTERHFARGENIYRAGDQAKALYVIHEGRVKISRLSPTGKEQVIRVLGPGDFMGELSLFSPQPIADNSEALEASTMCMIEGGRLKGLMTKYPAIALKVLEELSRRLEHAENLIEDINLHSAERRLAQSLLRLADARGDVRLQMTKGDFASQIGMTQETLSRRLAAFQEQGLIRQTGQRRIQLLDRQALDDIE